MLNMKTMRPNITGIGTANPEHRFAQSDILRFMVNAHLLEGDEARQLQVLYRASGIQYRHSVLEDYGRMSSEFSFYPPNSQLEPFPPLSARMKKYRETALPLCLRAVKNLEYDNKLDPSWAESVTHLVTVSCTGMYAPGLDLELTQKLGLPGTVHRTAINFMGCYAAFNALKMADTICRAEKNARVLIVCVELCTLHFQNKNEENNLLANALFADGAAAVLVQNDNGPGIALSPLNFHCDIDPSAENEMAWQIGDFGFEMKLSTYVPNIIQSGIAHLTKSLLARQSLQLADIDYFAIHPGGKRILEVIEAELGIAKEKNHAAYKVLRDYGNMSSPTVLFVLKEIFKSLVPGDHGKKILSFAFGPGLTLESMLLEVNAKPNA